MPFWDPASLSYEIDWSAWATIAAGMAAVVGAYRIGLRQSEIARRQVDIADRQTQILGHQVDLERIKVRAELYDRRVAVFEASLRFMDNTIEAPEAMGGPIWDDFMEAVGRSEFLFGVEVHSALAKMLGLRLNLVSAKQALAIVRSGLGEEERQNVLTAWDDIRDARRKLPDLFVPYIGLVDRLDRASPN